MSRSNAPSQRVSSLIIGSVYLTFGISGACGLAYQIVWSRMFGFELGHEWPAVLAMMAAFFGGLAIGSRVLDRTVSQSRFPGRWYGALEILIGTWGLVSISIIPKAGELGSGWIGLEPSPLRHWVIAFLLPCFTLLPATVAMGATFPAMERFVSCLRRNPKCVGGLYSVNTFGAVAGTLVATFAMIPRFGFTATLQILALLNGVCGVVIFLLDSRERRKVSEPKRQIARGLFSQRLRWTVFLTGLFGIGFEVLGVRILANVLENTVFSFAAALSVFLTGTAIGAGIYQHLEKRLSRLPSLEHLFIALCISCLAGTWLLSKSQILYDTAANVLGDGMAAMVLAELSVSSVVFGIPTLLMGAVFSHLAQLARSDDGGIGWVISWNMLGSAAAPIVFGVCLFPLMGAKWALVVVSIGYLGLTPRLSRWHAWSALPVAGLLIAIPSNLSSTQTPPGGALLEFREGVMSSVAVVRHFDNNRSLLVNNRFAMGGTGAAVAAQRHAHIPLLLHAEPRRALFLGLGTGITFGAASVYPRLEADGVELVPEVLAVGRHFEPLNRKRQGMKLYVADARRFIRASKEEYDVIVADLFHPARDGAGALYTVEHFQAIRQRLAPHGLFCQWLPLFQLDESMLRVITRTFLEVFPHARAFLLRWNVDTPVLGLIATIEPRRYPADWIESRAGASELELALKAVTLADSFQLFGTFLGGSENLRNFSTGAPFNTDDHPIVMFEAPRFTYRRNETPYGRLLGLLDQFSGTSAELIEADSQSADFSAELNLYFAARNRYLRGLIADSEGFDREATDAFIESARLSARFSAGYAHCLAIAVRQSKTDPAGARELLERLAEAQPQRPVAAELAKRLFGE